MSMPVVELRIRLVDGRIEVAGPLHDKILCMGMLELAKPAIMDFKVEEAQGIQAPPRGLMEALGAQRK